MPSNVLILCSDEHMRDAMGCYGHPLVKTPNLDALARRGTRFTNAYTPSPVCVPARASLATGRYVWQTGCWSNTQPFHGQFPGWGQRLIDRGHRVVSAGKLHYRSGADDNGFDSELVPLYLHHGIGWPYGLLLRGQHDVLSSTPEMAEQIGPGESDYTRYDRRVCQVACDWLEKAPRDPDRPWVLFASFVAPHYPLICPQEFYDLYPLDQVDAPDLAGTDTMMAHPVLAAMRRMLDYDDHFDDHTRLVARAAYYGLCSFVDHLMGRVIDTLERTGQAEDTLVVYVSDHGEMLGNKTAWTKCTMYEESVAIPMIAAGPGMPVGETCAIPASLIDLPPTVLQATGAGVPPEDAGLYGRSLSDLAAGEDPDRAVISEYHDGGAITGITMLRWRNWKYVYYAGYPPQLFDLAKDPKETLDLAADPGHRDVCAACEAKLRSFLDPEAENERAYRSQEAVIAGLGGKEAILNGEDFGFTPIPAED